MSLPASSIVPNYFNNNFNLVHLRDVTISLGHYWIVLSTEFKLLDTNNESTKRITVQGLPGTYENFHHIQSDELTLLEAGVLQKAEVVEGDSSLVEKNKTGRNILFFLLAGVGVAIALGFQRMKIFLLQTIAI